MCIHNVCMMYVCMYIHTTHIILIKLYFFFNCDVSGELKVRSRYLHEDATHINAMKERRHKFINH